MTTRSWRMVVVVFRRWIRFVFILLSSFWFSFNRALVFGDNTFWPHPDTQTLFETTLLTFSPHVHVNLTIIAIFALINSILGNATPEEACIDTFSHHFESVTNEFTNDLMLILTCDDWSCCETGELMKERVVATTAAIQMRWPGLRLWLPLISLRLWFDSIRFRWRGKKNKGTRKWVNEWKLSTKGMTEWLSRVAMTRVRVTRTRFVQLTFATFTS